MTPCPPREAKCQLPTLRNPSLSSHWHETLLSDNLNVFFEESSNFSLFFLAYNFFEVLFSCCNMAQIIINVVKVNLDFLCRIRRCKTHPWFGSQVGYCWWFQRHIRLHLRNLSNFSPNCCCWCDVAGCQNWINNCTLSCHCNC